MSEFSRDFEKVGFLRKDSFGRVFVDSCPSDEEHLKHHVEGKDRPGCRTYIEDLFPEDHLGKSQLVMVGVILVDPEGVIE